jgi:hypothetical protein
LAEQTGNAVPEQAGNKAAAIAKKRRNSALFRAFPDCRFDARPMPGGIARRLTESLPGLSPAGFSAIARRLPARLRLIESRKHYMPGFIYMGRHIAALVQLFVPYWFRLSLRHYAALARAGLGNQAARGLNMAKLVLGIALYAIAIAFILSAMAIAPDMQWPGNSVEIMAAGLLIIGLIAKLGGSIMILSIK